ncbi:hypothetical protein KEM60_03029 [Austwickia sp. TVS 96-490-7B]|uniref:helix-turn-helix transcriptional regulator n=1 Tax=Austwickia sp. TVS 96-490-7B TaxID=2830843 RepID=UPI001C5A17D1|nr:helix-turn-helix domain-containing protein [Austwickia sp. TVS 96-490-7B]MBW3086800.1 hypothetical protein [Austwickia sp. TVS 96-490-7B]
MSRRFLPLSEVCEILAISSAQGYALVRTGELPAIQIGGRGQWRVEASVLEEFISAKYAEQRAAAVSEQRESPA